MARLFQGLAISRYTSNLSDQSVFTSSFNQTPPEYGSDYFGDAQPMALLALRDTTSVRINYCQIGTMLVSHSFWRGEEPFWLGGELRHPLHV